MARAGRHDIPTGVHEHHRPADLLAGAKTGGMLPFHVHTSVAKEPRVHGLPVNGSESVYSLQYKDAMRQLWSCSQALADQIAQCKIWGLATHSVTNKSKKNGMTGMSIMLATETTLQSRFRTALLVVQARQTCLRTAGDEVLPGLLPDPQPQPGAAVHGHPLHLTAPAGPCVPAHAA